MIAATNKGKTAVDFVISAWGSIGTVFSFYTDWYSNAFVIIAGDTTACSATGWSAIEVGWGVWVWARVDGSWNVEVIDASFDNSADWSLAALALFEINSFLTNWAVKCWAFGVVTFAFSLFAASYKFSVALDFNRFSG